MIVKLLKERCTSALSDATHHRTNDPHDPLQVGTTYRVRLVLLSAWLFMHRAASVNRRRTRNMDIDSC